MLCAAALVAALTASSAAAAPAAKTAATPGPSSEAVEAGRWSFAIAVGVLVVALPTTWYIARWAWWAFVGRTRGDPAPQWGRTLGLLLGRDHRVSTSKTTAVVWTYTVAAALLSFLIARWLGHPDAFENLKDQGLNAQYALLIGGPIGAAILAAGIVQAQVDSGQTSKSAADQATPGQLVQNDSGDIDLGDLQYVLFNTIALLFFYGEFLHKPVAGMPTIPDVLLGLTSVAAAGYVGKKTLTGPGAIGDVKPAEAHVGDTVRLVTAGIVKTGDDLSLLTVTFGAAEAKPKQLTTTTSQGELLDVDVPPDAAGKTDLTVAVPNGKKATWPGFKIIPKIIGIRPGPEAAPGATLSVDIDGVKGLAPKLLGVTVTVAGKAATSAEDPDTNPDPTLWALRVTVPADAPEGPSKIVVATPGGSDEAGFKVLPS